MIILAITSCTTSKTYKYDLLLEKPATSENLVYESDTMQITFSFITEGIGFTLFNNLPNDGIRINWDELSMSTNGKAQRVVHKETGVVKLNDLQPPTTIPPKTMLEDVIIPREYLKVVYYAGNKMPVLANVYPTMDYGNKKTREKILSKRGQRVTFYMPFYIRGQYVSNSFEFTIRDVVEVKKGTKAPRTAPKEKTRSNKKP